MNPKERILAALTDEAVDYTPCAPVFWAGPDFWKPVQEVNFDVDPELNHINVPIDDEYKWSGLEEQIHVMRDVLGVDPVLYAGVSFSDSRRKSKRRNGSRERDRMTFFIKRLIRPQEFFLHL